MSVAARLRSGFVAGTLLVTPLAVTVFVLDFAFDRLTLPSNPIVRTTGLTAYTGHVEIAAQLAAAALLASALTLLGYAAEDATGEELYTAFVPHSPNPTAGSLVMAADAEVYDLDMSVRRGLRLVVTIGLGVEDPEELPAGVVR